MELFKPWIRSSHDFLVDVTDQVDSLTRFISQTAQSLAFMGQLDSKSYHGYPIIGRSAHLQMLCTALLKLALLPQSACGSLSPYNFTVSHHGCCASPSPFVTVKSHEVLREWRLIQSDADVDLGRCTHCRRLLDGDERLRICRVCSACICNDCYSTMITSTPRSLYLQPLKVLLQLERELTSVLDSLEAIASRSSEVLRRVLSQNDNLKCWVYSKTRAYSDWENQYCEGSGLQVRFNHFRKTDFVGWIAINIMARCLSLEVVQCSDSDMFGPNGQDDPDPWTEATQLWRDVYAFERPGAELQLPCTHGRFLELTPVELCSIDGHLIHDSSGQVSFEVFEALAKKYEEFGKDGNATMKDLQSTRVSDWLFGGPLTETNSPASLLIPESLRDYGDTGDGTRSARSDSTSSEGIPEQPRPMPAPTPELESEPGSTDEEESEDFTGNEGMPEDWIEDLLDDLLEKFNSLGEETLEKAETELVLETAWEMGQAIVYHDTPRPSLKEISEQNVGFYTAPASPATSNLSHGRSDRSVTMYTARSISPISWFPQDDFELDEVRGGSFWDRLGIPIASLEHSRQNFEVSRFCSDFESGPSRSFLGN